MTRVSLLGDDCVRIDLEADDDKHALARHLRASEDWSDIVIGKTNVSVQFSPCQFLPDEALARVCHQLERQITSENSQRGVIEIPVSMAKKDAPDLKWVSELAGLSPNSFWRQMASRVFTIDMLGFTPGFAYMSGVPENWQIERLSSPRVSVPAGSVGVLTGQCGLYALDGPGGWPIIGRALIPLFDSVSVSEPILYQAGDRIRFILVGSGND